MAKKVSTESKLAESIQNLEEGFDRWRDLYVNGGSDPFWSDGCNLGLVRNHIIYYKKEIEKLCSDIHQPLPDICLKETPFEVPQYYYAKRNYIIDLANDIIKKVEATYSIDNYKKDSSLVQYFHSFKQQLEENNLAYVRKFTFESFAEHANKSEKRLHSFGETHQGQLELVETTRKPNNNFKNVVIDQKEKLIPIYNKCLQDVQLNWTRFLDCSIVTYKHTFPNQSMIFGQDQTVTMVADEKTWNKIGRYLNFGARYITTIATKSHAIIEHRLYDVNQTYGDEVNVDPNKFILTSDDNAALHHLLSQKYHTGSQKLADDIKQIIAGIYQVSPLSSQLKPFERLIKNSTYYVICKKLGVLANTNYTSKFNDIKHASLQLIPSIGKSVNTTSLKILNEIEVKLKEIRSHDYEYNNQQRELHNDGQRSTQMPLQRDTLQERIERSIGNPNPSTSNRDSTAGGQLSFGQIWSNSNEISARGTQREVRGTDDERNSNGKTSPSRGSSFNHEGEFRGTNPQEKPSSSDRQHLGGNATPRVDKPTSGRNGEGGTLQGNLVNTTNFRFNNTTVINFGGSKTKYRNNVEAIKLLKAIEEDGHPATSSEQQILAKYVGWGGLSNVFNAGHKDWQNEYIELKELLTDDEYNKARASTLTAYYTEPAIVKAMWSGIINLGFTNVTGKLKILDPALGTGNFYSSLPSKLNNAQLHGVELDDLTGRLAQKLHPQAEIQIKGYQETMFQDSLFDVCIGNVPFGEFKVSDDKHSLLIHDYFFAKSLDKVKPNGIIAFITSKGTLDKANPTFRKYMAERAELIGAVRLPNTAFKAIAGTEATTDIIFLRKREKMVVDEPNWVSTSLNENDVPINQYYLDNPQNLMGEMVFESSQFGKSAVLKPFEDFNLYDTLEDTINAFTQGKLIEKDLVVEEKQKVIEDIIAADPNVKNFTYTVIEDKIYYRENESMSIYDGKQAERIKALHAIRQTVREIIFIQSHPYDSSDLSSAQYKLNSQYDDFVKKHGYINDKVNKRAFADDSDYPLLLSIENIDSSGAISKAKIFTQATIKPHTDFVPQSYEDLITLSMSTLGELDIQFMADQFNVKLSDVIDNLKGKIYLNPHNDKYETADQYLSGNVKEKLDYAKEKTLETPEIYTDNVQALELVQPTPLTADEIDMKLGSSFIDIKYYKQFIYEKSETPRRYWQTSESIQSKDEITLVYNDFTSEYTIYGKGNYSSVKTNSAYGTDRKSFYSIVEDSLNLKDTKVYDIKFVNDKEKPVLNGKETRLARQKQELIRHEFKDWLLSDINRANDVIKTYNDRFNVYRLQEFDGSKLFFEGMSNEITLRPHQKDAVARCLYSGRNVLLGHVVGSGKTYTMVAAAMELKRIGISNKPLFVVPNHLTEQWGSDFLKLYPNANILVAKKKDFEPLNRKRFFGRICTGEYDAIIIGHTQFEKIPMSKDFLRSEIENQMIEITSAISMMKEDEGSKRYSIKQMEAQKIKLKERLETLDKKKKDDVIIFEETGIDHIFIDEAHNFKNCYIHTKMSNVAGVTTTNAQKSFDMLMKSKYITYRNDGKGVVFATGTPISNSMTEMFVMQRYLQPDALKKAQVSYFDQWASTFGETVTALELKPEGTGYRLNTRFAKFHNLPELMNMFAQVADIKVAADLNLPVPRIATGKPIIVLSPISEYIKRYIDKLADRAEDIRNGNVDPWDDNMLKITGEGKSVAIDPRIIDPHAPVNDNSKVYKCCNNIYDIWLKTTEQRGAQLVFSDVSTPNGKIPMKMVNGVAEIDTSLFSNLYEEIRRTLIKKGIPQDEIAFIHSAKTEEQKATLFAKVRSGEIRVLIGSTSKMGAGTNVQERLAAVHHMDCPWRPADIEQRDGRILRQGNMFDEVYIYRYITENTFDAYLWQIQENKQKFITQIMTNKCPVRSCDDIDSAVLDCAEIKILATGDPRVKQKMQLDNDIYMLQIEKSAYIKEKIKLQNIVLETPKKIDILNQRIPRIISDITQLYSNKAKDFAITIGGITYDERADAGNHFNKLLNSKIESIGAVIGNYCGLDLVIVKQSYFETIQIGVVGNFETRIDLGSSDTGNMTRIENVSDALAHSLRDAEQHLVDFNKLLVDAEEELQKPFTNEKELAEKLQRQVSLNAEMEINKPSEILISEEENRTDKIRQNYEDENER